MANSPLNYLNLHEFDDSVFSYLPPALASKQSDKDAMYSRTRWVAPEGYGHAYLHVDGYWTSIPQITHQGDATVKSFVSSSNNGAKDKSRPHAYSYTKTITPLGRRAERSYESDGQRKLHFLSFRNNFQCSLNEVGNLALVTERATKKLYSKIKMSDINLATTTIVEGGESVELVRKYARLVRMSPHELLNHAFKDLAFNLVGKKQVVTKRRVSPLSSRVQRRSFVRTSSNKKSGNDALNAVSGGYLEYVLALKPLITDIYNVATHLHKSVTNGEIYSIVSTSIDDGDFTHVGTDGWTETNVTRNLCKIGVTYTIRNADMHNASRLASFNPALWLWEKKSMSFVADWFYDISGFMKGLEAKLLNGLSFSHGYESTLTYNRRMRSISTVISEELQTSQFENYAKRNPGYRVFVSDEAACTSTYVHFERKILGGFPAPPLPTLKKLEVFSGKALTLAALLTSFSTARSKKF
jgi:hypothetical protein